MTKYCFHALDSIYILDDDLILILVAPEGSSEDRRFPDKSSLAYGYNSLNTAQQKDVEYSKKKETTRQTNTSTFLHMYIPYMLSWPQSMYI